MKTRVFLSIICSVLMILVGCQKEPTKSMIVEDTSNRTNKKINIDDPNFDCVDSQMPFYIIFEEEGNIFSLEENPLYSGNCSFSLNLADWYFTYSDGTTTTILNTSNISDSDIDLSSFVVTLNITYTCSQNQQLVYMQGDLPPVNQTVFPLEMEVLSIDLCHSYIFGTHLVTPCGTNADPILDEDDESKCYIIIVPISGSFVGLIDP